MTMNRQDTKQRNFGRNFIKRASWDENMEKHTAPPNLYIKEILTTVGIIFCVWLAIELTNLLSAMIITLT